MTTKITDVVKPAIVCIGQQMDKNSKIYLISEVLPFCLSNPYNFFKLLHLLSWSYVYKISTTVGLNRAYCYASVAIWRLGSVDH